MTVSSNHIRLSCRLELLPGASVLERVQAAERFGFEAVALPGRHLATYRDELLQQVAQLPLPLSAMSLGFEGSLVSPDPERRAACRRSLVELFDLCRQLGIGFLNMPPVLIQDNPRRSDDAAEQDAWLLEQLPQVTDAAKQRGVTLLLEPVNRYETDYVTTIEHAADLCRRSGCANLGITPDLFHMQIEQRHGPDSLIAAADVIRYFHVAENTREEPGVGQMDFAGPFAALKRIGYDGFIELESRTLSGPAEQTLPRTVDYLRQCWDAAGRTRK